MRTTFFKVTKGIISLAVLAITILLAVGCAPVNHPPSITSLQAKRNMVPPSGSCQIECITSDPDGDELSYQWFASNGSISGTGATISWTAPETVGICTIAVKVVDDMGGESTNSLSIKIGRNNPPIIGNFIATPKEPKYMAEIPGGYKILKGNSCEIKCVASDPDNDELLYEWSTNGGNISGEGPAVTWTAPLREEKVTISVRVSDNSGGARINSIVFVVKTCTCAFE